MITLQGNREILKSAQILESRTRNTYPHLSTSKIRKSIGYDVPDPKYFAEMKKEYRTIRKMIRESGNYYTSLIQALAYGRIGNCTEDAMFTELLGKINGQDNIYTGSIGLLKDNQELGYLNHVVAFITDEPISVNKNFFCKNKEAVIIDPWLGITDFAGSYFNKLKTIFRKVFMNEMDKRFVTFSNDELATKFIREMSKTPKDFNSNRKNFLPSTKLCVIPFADNLLNSEKINNIKESFPELVIQNYKAIKLTPKKSKSTDYIA